MWQYFSQSLVALIIGFRLSGIPLQLTISEYAIKSLLKVNQEQMERRSKLCALFHNGPKGDDDVKMSMQEDPEQKPACCVLVKVLTISLIPQARKHLSNCRTRNWCISLEC